MEGGDLVEGEGAASRIVVTDIASEAVKCSECDGCGAIVLLTSRRPCTACGGKGEITQMVAHYAFEPSGIPDEPLDGCDWSLDPAYQYLAGLKPTGEAG